MKKILTIIAMAMAATVAYAQSFEFTDIQVNTETEVHVATPLEPLPHTFINVGYSMGLGARDLLFTPSIMVGWYKLHGIFAGFSKKSISRETDTDKYEELSSTNWRDRPDDAKLDDANISLYTVGYIYNIPYSRNTGSDLDNYLQLYVGLGYGSAKYYTVYCSSSEYYYSLNGRQTSRYDYNYSYQSNENTSGIAFDLGLLLTYKHFNFRAGMKAIAGGGGYFDVGIGLGYTF